MFNVTFTKCNAMKMKKINKQSKVDTMAKDRSFSWKSLKICVWIRRGFGLFLFLSLLISQKEKQESPNLTYWCI